jgi:hypothetical protein
MQLSDRRRAMLATVISYVRRHHLGLLALFVALSGTAYAATLPRYFARIATERA